MRLYLSLALALTLLAQNAGIHRITGGFLTGNEYLDFDVEKRNAYATGFFNGMSVAAELVDVSDDRLKWLDTCSTGMTGRQIAEIIRGHIQDTPAQWHLPLNVLGLNAMLAACKDHLPPKATKKD